ncbi:MAG: hypothetical protein S4CHLAM37_01040 [Chlamydiia bacterium]|nr:hypothetical protein [Chlamydiia bacterium]
MANELCKKDYIMKFRLIITGLMLASFLTLGAQEYPQVESIEPVAAELKPRLPEWRPKIVERFADGNPTIVLFYEEADSGESHPTKRMSFYPNGRTREETDLIVITKDDPAFKLWDSQIVPHGVSVQFDKNGPIRSIRYYDKGLLHGTLGIFYSDGKPEQTCSYSQGQKHGKAYSFYEDGTKSEDATYAEGLLEGDFIRYYPSGNKCSVTPYQNDVAEGKMMEWHDNGAIKSTKNYVHGKLHSDANNPACISYNENNGIVEMRDFNQGEPVGIHITYHDNGRESYKVPYYEGKKHGKEQFFDEDGIAIGEGKYEKGKKVSKHWKNHDKSTLAFLAVYDKEGTLVEPIKEYDINGSLVAKYSMIEDQYDGEYKKWYPDGKQKLCYNYKNGDFDGSQEEFFQNGNIKIRAHYKDGEKHGEFTEFFEDGNLQLQVTYEEGKKQGELFEWYANKQMKTKWRLKDDDLHGIQTQWHPDGKMKMQVCYEDGKKQGDYKMWNLEGDLVFQANYMKDQPVGEFRSYFAKDTPKEVCYFNHEGNREGRSQEFFENGNVKFESFYKDNKLEGQSKGWFEDGTLNFIRRFKDGLPVGRQEEFYSKDKWVDQRKPQLYRYFFYNDEGKLEGEQKTYYPNGVTQSLLCYSEGELHGMKALWDKEGNLLEESYLENGKLNGRFFEKDKEGREVIYHYVMNKKEGAYTIYYPPHPTFGKMKAMEANYANNKLEGEVVEYDQQGKVTSVTPYVDGEKHGTAKLFNGQDKVMMTLDFVKNKREGISYQYFPTGKVYRETPFENDQKEGLEKTFYDNGEIANTYEYHEGKLDGSAKSWNPNGVLVFEGNYEQGKRHGKFNKYYDDGTPSLEQIYTHDLLDGKKRIYNLDGTITEVVYEKGRKLEG